MKLTYQEFDATPLEGLESDAPVRDWMTVHVHVVTPDQKLQEVTELLNRYQIYSVPVVSAEGELLGLVTKSTLVQALFNGCPVESLVSEIMEHQVATIGPDERISQAVYMRDGCLPVVDEKNRLVGILTRTDMLKANNFHLKHFKQAIDYAEALKLVLNSAYEGIVVIDQEGTIVEFNEAYCRFIGKSREEVIGQDVRKVIDNTRLHIVVKTGQEERGYIQRIHGQDMIVHRIPIKRGETVVGAIGMLIFEDVTQLYHILGRIHQIKRQEQENEVVFSEKETYHLDKIIGSSKAIFLAKKMAKKAAMTPSTVLITGESGTGKEVFAQAIHDLSPFSDGPLVSVNCSAIPEALLESELFGYEEGAFTDARKGGKPGKFELADQGSIFLDEIGDMPLLMQAKILRVLQERIVERVGSTHQRKINVRVIAATNRDLEELVKEGRFRSDLYYRINIIRLHLPPLRERHEDIPRLLEHFIHRFCSEFGFARKRLSREALLLLQAYEWQGNVRELMNVCEMLVSLVEEEEILPADLPEHIHQSVSRHAIQVSLEEQAGIRTVMDTQEKYVILDALQSTGGNKAAAARLLGIQRSTLYMKMKKHRIDQAFE